MPDRATRGSSRSAWGPRAFTASLAVAWVALAALSIRLAGHLYGEDVVALVVMTAMAAISIHVQGTAVSRAGASFLLVVLLACLPLFGPLVAGVLGLLWAIADRKYGLSIVPVFNGAMSGVTALLGGLAYVAVGGVVPVVAGLSPADLLLRVGLPLVLADLVMTFTNAALLTAMVAMTGGQPRTVLLERSASCCRCTWSTR